MKRYLFFLLQISLIITGCSHSINEVPDELTGNYYDKDGNDFWSYSIQKNFIISDCKFWDVRKIKIRKSSTKIIAVNENSKKRIQISAIKGNDVTIKDGKVSKIYSTAADSVLRKAKNSPFSMCPGKVKISGFIKNSKKYTESSPRIQFLYHDYIAIKTNSVFAPIDSLGRFQLEMELLTSQDIMFKLGNMLHLVFVSPNDTLMLYFDPEHPENSEFQGTHADVNYDLLNTKETRYKIDSPLDDQNHLSKHFLTYKQHKDSVRNREMQYLSEYSRNDYCSELFKIWFETNSKINYQINLLNYSWKNYYVKDVESSREAYSDYLDTFFEEIDINDTIAPITGRYFFYSMAVNNKIPRDRKSFYDSINEELKKEANELSLDEKKSKASEIYCKKMLVILQGIENGRLRDLFFTQLVSKEIENRNIDNIDKTLNLISEHVHYKPYLDHISNYVTDFKRKELEFANNPITFRKSSSKGEQLIKKIVDDNKDKVIILDFWFTGCGACRKNFELINTFKKDLSLELDVEFVYLCYNSTEKDWKYVSKEFNLKGSNYLLTQEQFIYFQDLFSISGAPRYILINKAGKVVNSNFKPPLNKNQYMIELKNALL